MDPLSLDGSVRKVSRPYRESSKTPPAASGERQER
jgi:hypothetical protein